MISKESSSILFGENTLDLSNDVGEFAAAFISQVGLENARHIEAIRIQMPHARLQEGSLQLNELSAQVLNMNPVAERISTYMKRVEEQIVEANKILVEILTADDNTTW